MADTAVLIAPAEQTAENPILKWRTFLAVWLGHMFDGLDASIFVITLVPALSALLHTSSYTTIGVYGSITMAAFMIGWAIGGGVSGLLCDYIGRTRVLMLTILLYAICTGLCATSHNWGELAFYRFLVGCGIGGEVSAGGVLLAESWKGNSRLHVSGLLPGAFCVGYLITAILSLGILNWRWLFLVGIIPALLTVYIRTKIKEPPSIEAALEQRKRLLTKPKSDLTQQETEALSFTFGRLFKGEYLYKTLLTVTLSSITIIGYWAALSWVPAWINQLMGASAVQERSIATIIMNIGSITASAMTGLLVTRFGRRKAFGLAFLGAMISCVGMFLTVKTFGISLLAWAFSAGFFCVLPFCLFFIYIPELFNAEMRGTAFGFTFQIGRLSAAMAALLGGQLVVLFGGSYAMVGASLAFVYLFGIVASFFLPQTSGEVI